MELKAYSEGKTQYLIANSGGTGRRADQLRIKSQYPLDHKQTYPQRRNYTHSK